MNDTSKSSTIIIIIFARRCAFAGLSKYWMCFGGQFLGRRLTYWPAIELLHGARRASQFAPSAKVQHRAACRLNYTGTRDPHWKVYALQFVREISRSSTFFPDLSCVLTQRGCFPRPDQVSKGRSGLRYFGLTFGYGRGAFSWCSMCPLSRAKRRTSSCFSASNFVDRITASPSRRIQSSLMDILARFLFFTRASSHVSRFSRLGYHCLPRV